MIIPSGWKKNNLKPWGYSRRYRTKLIHTFNLPYWSIKRWKYFLTGRWATGRAVCSQLCQAPPCLSVHDAAAPLGGLRQLLFVHPPTHSLSQKSTEDLGNTDFSAIRAKNLVGWVGDWYQIIPTFYFGTTKESKRKKNNANPNFYGLPL